MKQALHASGIDEFDGASTGVGVAGNGSGSGVGNK
jgi:hypothetical protein